MNNIKFSDFEHLLKLPELRVKTEIVDGKEFRIVSYVYSTLNLWYNEGAVECRGITFDENGDCVNRPFQKFFNVGENEQSQEEDFDFENAVAMEKLDGSMISPVLVNGNIHFKSKNTFYSDVAIEANKCASNDLIKYCKLMISKGYTPIYEFIHNDHKIVLDYHKDTPNFTLLALRHMGTGKYIDFNDIIIPEIENAKVVTVVKLSYAELLEKVNTAEDIEGWVFKSKDSYIKKKINWYVTRNKSIPYTERKLGDMLVNGTIDDLIPILNAEQKTIYFTIEEKIQKRLNTAISEIKRLSELCEEVGSKRFYQENSSIPLVKYVSSYIKDRLDLEDIWKKMYRNEFDHEHKVFWL